MTTGELQFAAFLSYSRKDERLARWLVRSLEEFGLPRQTVDDLKARRALFLAVRPIFRDVHDMPVGGVISKRLVEVLDGSGAMIVLCTPASARSAWVNEEVQRFAALHPDRRIIPAVAEGEPETDGCYPPALLALGKPLAADLRRPGERRQAVVKIAAAVLGLDVDQLVGRVQKRRAEQVRWLAIGGGAAAAAVVGLAVTAGVMADRAGVEAERASEQIMHLLTKTRVDMKDLAGKRALHEAAQIYFDSKAGQRFSDKDLLLKAEWLRQEGVDAGRRGEEKQALADRQEAYAATSELLKRDPDNPDFLFSHGQSAYWLGFYYFERGQPDAARGPLETYRSSAERLLAVAPDYVSTALQTDARTEVHYARFNLGMLSLEKERDPRAAALAFASGLTVLDPSPEGLDAQLNLSRAHLTYVSALAQFASASEVLEAVERWRPILAELESQRGASSDLDFHLANSWDKIVNAVEGHVDAGEASLKTGQQRQVVPDGPGRDPDDVVSLTFAAEIRLRAGDAPDCSKLPNLAAASVAKSEELRLASECLPALPRKQQLERCGWFAETMKDQANRFALEPVWSQLLVACSKAAARSQKPDLSRSLEDVATTQFFSRPFEEMRLWTQLELADFRTVQSNIWINNLNASLDSRGWTNRGEN